MWLDIVTVLVADHIVRLATPLDTPYTLVIKSNTCTRHTFFPRNDIVSDHTVLVADHIVRLATPLDTPYTLVIKSNTCTCTRHSVFPRNDGVVAWCVVHVGISLSHFLTVLWCPCGGVPGHRLTVAAVCHPHATQRAVFILHQLLTKPILGEFLTRVTIHEHDYA